MATGDWWFKFNIPVWRSSPELRKCSLETRGFWIDCIAIMRDTGTAVMKGTYEDFARAIGCLPAEAERCINELKRHKTASVTQINGNVTLKSRRYARELKVKEQTKLRVRKLRGNATVTQGLRDKVKSNKKEVKSKSESSSEDSPEKESVFVTRARGIPPLPDPPELTDYFREASEALCGLMGVIQLPPSENPLWVETIRYAYENKFPVQRIAETYSLMRQQKWRQGRISPKTLQENLANLEGLRSEVERQNGTNSRTRSEQAADRTGSVNDAIAALRNQGSVVPGGDNGNPAPQLLIGGAAPPGTEAVGPAND